MRQRFINDTADARTYHSTPRDDLHLENTATPPRTELTTLSPPRHARPPRPGRRLLHREPPSRGLALSKTLSHSRRTSSPPAGVFARSRVVLPRDLARNDTRASPRPAPGSLLFDVVRIYAVHPVFLAVRLSFCPLLHRYQHEATMNAST